MRNNGFYLQPLLIFNVILFVLVNPLSNSLKAQTTMNPWVQTAMLTASGSADWDLLGSSVALSADSSTLVIGAPNNAGGGIRRGAVYVYTNPMADSSTPIAKLTMSAPPDGFGSSVAVNADGSIIVAGAPYDNSQAGVSIISRGAVYVYTRPAGGWTNSNVPAAILTVSSGGNRDGLGSSVTLSADGSTLIAGAPGNAAGGISRGAAYIYTKSPGGWTSSSTPAATLTVSSGADWNYLADSVAINRDGNILAVGAPNAGAVYVYIRPSSGWTSSNSPTATLRGATGENFGKAVALNADGSTIVVGARLSNGGIGGTERGSVYVYTKPAGGWTNSNLAVATLTVASGTNGDFFGDSVAVNVDGSILVAGAPYKDRGVVYVYTKPSNGWVSSNAPSSMLMATGGAKGDFLGDSVAVNADGNAIVAGVPYNAAGGTGRGMVSVFTPIVDLSFRPDPNGYKFPNYRFPWNDFYTNADYSESDMELMFGSNAVCSTKTGSGCTLKPTAAKWRDDVNSNMNWNGRCYGMAVTSLRFFRKFDQPSLYGANSTFDLTQDKVRRRIAYIHVEQFTNPTRSYLIQNLQTHTPATILSQLRTALQNASDPPVLAVYRDMKIGHAITPYEIEPRGNGVFWIRVYDNSYAGDANRYVVIDTVADTWRYDGMSGNATTHSLGLVPISLSSETISTCAWCSSTNQSAASSSVQLWSNGNGNLLITNDQGQQIGFSNNQFINEISNAYGLPVLGDVTADTEPIYDLPLSGKYSILLDGNPLTQTKSMDVTQFGPGYAVSVGGAILKPATQDRLTITSDGTQITYGVSETKTITLALAIEGTSASTQFQLQGVDIGTGQSVQATVDAPQGKLAFSNTQADGGNYNLEVERTSAVGAQTFTHSTVSILAGDTQYVNYGAWNGSESIILEVDHGSNGTIDQTIVLENETKKTYLPIIYR